VTRSDFWPEGLSREDMLRCLPVVGIDAGTDVPFDCVLPGHEGHTAHVDGHTFAYCCHGASAIFDTPTTRST
jgi:hypothetical protein